MLIMIRYENVPIVHQQQSLPDSCVCASLAMILNVPESELLEKYHTDYRTTTSINEYSIIKDYVSDVKVHYTSDRTVEPSRTYLLTVPSLNIEGGTHAVVIHVDEDLQWAVFDPCHSKEGRRYYVAAKTDKEWEVPLTSYCMSLSISNDELNRRYGVDND